MYDFAVRKANPQPVTARADDIRPYAEIGKFRRWGNKVLAHCAFPQLPENTEIKPSGIFHRRDFRYSAMGSVCQGVYTRNISMI